MRAYDDPNHPHYGPVRRMWVILVALWEDLDKLDEAYFMEWGETWDQTLINGLTGPRWTERQANRVVVYNTLSAVTGLGCDSARRN